MDNPIGLDGLAVHNDLPQNFVNHPMPFNQFCNITYKAPEIGVLNGFGDNNEEVILADNPACNYFDPIQFQNLFERNNSKCRVIFNNIHSEP